MPNIIHLRSTYTLAAFDKTFATRQRVARCTVLRRAASRPKAEEQFQIDSGRLRMIRDKVNKQQGRAVNLPELHTTPGHAVEQLVKALRYKSADRGFDYRWCHWHFSLT
jgi:hypothetical protein